MATKKETVVDKEFEDLLPNKKRIKNILIAVGVLFVCAFVFIVSIKQEERKPFGLKHKKGGYTYGTRYTWTI